jgi:nucleoside-diphosphate-sugar epimerase
LWNIPLLLLKIAGFASGAVRQLLGSLEVDTTRIRRELEWTPPFTLEQGLARTFQEARV